MYDEFEYLCNTLRSICSLTVPTDDDVFVLQTDASARTIPSVLSAYRDNQELPIAFYSKKLKPAEMSYSVTELEYLAIIRSIQQVFGLLDWPPLHGGN